MNLLDALDNVKKTIGKTGYDLDFNLVLRNDGVVTILNARGTVVAAMSEEQYIELVGDSK